MGLRAWTLLVVLVAPFLTGCIGSGGEDDLDTNDAAADIELVDPMAALDAGEPVANLELLSEFRDGFGQEADVWGDYLFVDQGSSVSILDISNPEAPEHVSSISLPAVVDVKVSDDGNWMFTGEDQELSGPPLGGTGPLIGGFYVTDISDKENPTFVSYLPVGHGRGPHMVFYHQYPDGREIVFGAAGESIVMAEFDRDAGELTEIGRYMPGLTNQVIDPRVTDVLYGARGWAHDMFVMTEADGSVLMYVAAWDSGVHVVDVSDPAAPEGLGMWMDFDAEEETGNVHTVSTEWIGDRRITVAAVEVGFAVVGNVHYVTGTESSVLYVLDTTEPGRIELLGKWTNPIDPTSGRDLVPDEEVSSTHNLQLEGGRVYLAHYALGAWVLDVSTPQTQGSPAVLAYYMDDAASVWDVVVREGVMYTSGGQGVLGFHYVDDVLGPAGVTSRA